MMWTSGYEVGWMAYRVSIGFVGVESIGDEYNLPLRLIEVCKVMGTEAH